MKQLTIRSCAKGECTILDNTFIDQYMAKANGEYVKVYLLLLRCLYDPSSSLSLSDMADRLENTEKDITRAIHYWAKEGLLSIEHDAVGQISGICFGAAFDAPAPDDHPSSSDQDAAPIRVSAETFEHTDSRIASGAASIPTISQYKSRKEFKQLLFIAEQYIGKTLSPSDVETVTYFYDTLQFSADLVEYLIEYCVENGHRSMHYIKSVALAWADSGITTVEEARLSSSRYNKSCYSVLNAFGIKGRGPASIELAYIKKWTEEYGFALEIIVEACNRTIAATHQPSFDYADKILRNWHAKQVRHLSDLTAIDSAYRKEQQEKRQNTSSNRGYGSTASYPSKTKFNNFEERSYDMDELERQLLKSN